MVSSLIFLGQCASPVVHNSFFICSAVQCPSLLKLFPRLLPEARPANWGSHSITSINHIWVHITKPS